MPLIPIIVLLTYYISYKRCKNRLAESDKQLTPCINWAKSRGLELPRKPSFIEFYIFSIAYKFRFPFWIIIKNLQFSKDVRFYEKEMKLLFNKWNLEQNN